MREPYEVFISFKNSDEQGRLTDDSRLGEELHRYLSDRGLRAFFSNTSLEKIGAADYSETIDNALDEATILVAVGTSVASLNSRWVRYEWDSFSNDILAGKKPYGRVFVYARGIRMDELPRKLRQTQCIEDGPGSIERLYRFIRNALDEGGKAVVSGEHDETPNDASPDPGRKDPSLAAGGKRYFRVAVLGRVGERQELDWQAYRRAMGLPASREEIDWSAFCAELGARIVKSGYALYGTRSATAGGAAVQAACKALGVNEKSPLCRLMPELPKNASQRRLVKAAFLGEVDVGVVVGGTISTREECEMLQKSGGLLIPVGASGGTAFAYWSRLREEYKVHFSKEMWQGFEALGDPTRKRDDHLSDVIRLVEGRHRLHGGSGDRGGA